MQELATRKLIDIKAPTFKALSLKAKRQGVSLKRYIENLLDDVAQPEIVPGLDGVTDKKILSLIGIAKPTVSPESIKDDRLSYILSK